MRRRWVEVWRCGGECIFGKGGGWKRRRRRRRRRGRRRKESTRRRGGESRVKSREAWEDNSWRRGDDDLVLSFFSEIPFLAQIHEYSQATYNRVPLMQNLTEKCVA
jgi:iron only hydrogenase large subunit-like protein